ncbi:MAG: hypothetical protein M0Q13_12310 [Methanothrix sp.]|jgi:hypothetical protein|nr:hypothetical protein [Methanothrix sp.]
MKVDTVAAVQGAHNVRDANKISEEFHSKVVSAFYNISTMGKLGRRSCEYGELLVALSKVQGSSKEWRAVWEIMDNTILELSDAIKESYNEINSIKK